MIDPSFKATFHPARGRAKTVFRAAPRPRQPLGDDQDFLGEDRDLGRRAEL